MAGYQGPCTQAGRCVLDEGCPLAACCAAARTGGITYAAGWTEGTITHADLSDALEVLANRTGNPDAYFPALADFIFAWVRLHRPPRPPLPNPVPAPADG